MGLKLMTGEFFGVGNAPKQVRRLPSISAGNETLGLLRDTTDGLEQEGPAFLKSDTARRLYRNSVRFDKDSETPDIVLGTGYKNNKSYLRDFRDIYRFTILLEQESAGIRDSSRVQYIVSGYTDRTSRIVSSRDSIDPETILHISNVVKTRITPSKSSLGGRREYNTTVLESNNYIVNNTIERRKEWTFTPSDLSIYTDDYSQGGSAFEDQITAHNGLNTVSLNSITSSPDGHLISSAAADAASMEDASAVVGFEDAGGTSTSRFGGLDCGGIASYNIHNLAKDNIERGIITDTFYKVIHNNMDLDDVESIEMLRNDGCIPLYAILNACGVSERDLDRFIDIALPENEEYDSEEWRYGDGATLAAYDVCHRIPDIMINNLIKGVSFVVSNMGSRRYGRNEVEFRYAGDYDLSGRDSYAIVPISGVGHLDRFFLDKFQDTIIDEVFNNLTHNGEILMELVVHGNLAGLTRVEIVFDDGSVTPYTFTSFCENRLSTNLASGKNKTARRLIETNNDLRTRVQSGLMLHNKGSWDTNQPASREKPTASLDDLLARTRR